MKALANIQQHHSTDLMELHQFESSKSSLKSLTRISGRTWMAFMQHRYTGWQRQVCSEQSSPLAHGRGGMTHHQSIEQPSTMGEALPSACPPQQCSPHPEAQWCGLASPPVMRREHVRLHSQGQHARGRSWSFEHTSPSTLWVLLPLHPTAAGVQNTAHIQQWGASLGGGWLRAGMW